jgi:hypothetical protein
VTERNINGDVPRSKFQRARKILDGHGVSGEDINLIADGVREFDAQQSAEQRSLAALEKIASALAPANSGKGENWEWEERRLRRREVYAQELLAVAYLADDVADPNLEAIRQSPGFQRLVDRLKGPGIPDASS